MFTIFTRQLKSINQFALNFESEDHNTIPAQEETRSQIVIKEMSLFEATKKRSNNLANLYLALLTNKRTSVEPERASSATGLFVTKLRSSLNDESMLLIAMRQYQWRTQKIFIGGLVQGYMVVICFWCALFVTSQFDVISMFPNQRFGEVCCHSMHIFLHPLFLLYMSLH